MSREAYSRAFQHDFWETSFRAVKSLTFYPAERWQSLKIKSEKYLPQKIQTNKKRLKTHKRSEQCPTLCVQELSLAYPWYCSTPFSATLASLVMAIACKCNEPELDFQQHLLFPEPDFQTAVQSRAPLATHPNFIAHFLK